jgi:hypothetical protein
MYNVNDILARIQKGESPEAIANEFAAAVNAAIDLDKKEKEAAAQKAKEEAAAKETKLNGYIVDMTTAMTNYIKLANPEVADLMTDADLIDPAEIRKMLDQSINAALAMIALTDAMKNNSAAAQKLTSIPSKPASFTATMTPDDAIDQFLKNFGL